MFITGLIILNCKTRFDQRQIELTTERSICLFTDRGHLKWYYSCASQCCFNILIKWKQNISLYQINPNFQSKITETETNLILLTHIHDCWLSWLGTDTLIKSGGLNLLCNCMTNFNEFFFTNEIHTKAPENYIYD